FDVKNEAVLKALEDAPKIGESLCDACRAHFDQVKAHLDDYGVEYTLAPTLVRGLDYYTRTTFEFIDAAVGAQSSICGGGRLGAAAIVEWSPERSTIRRSGQPDEEVATAELGERLRR